MQIRQAEPADAAALLDITRRAYAHYVDRIGLRPAPMDADYAARVRDGSAFVAEDAEGPAGLVVLAPAHDHLLVENVAVEPARQGRGIGRALLVFAEAEARRRGLAELRLYTHVLMHENLALYAHLGYREDERRAEHGFERVFLSKRLGPAGPGG